MKSIEKHALQTGPRYSQKDCVMVSRGTKIFHNYPLSRFANYCIARTCMDMLSSAP